VTSQSSFSLAGKRALVTGASRGLGQAMAIALAGAGADVVCASSRHRNGVRLLLRFYLQTMFDPSQKSVGALEVDRFLARQ
jgi:NAD(P)-dependent dehydrogenase (short-subunit alcohol dehydrogenase family)